MRRLSLAILSIGSILLAGLQIAFAADVRHTAPPPARPAPPPAYVPYSWSGLYFGGHFGFNWSDEGATFIGGGLSGALDPNGVNAGGQIGANWQIGSWVLGVEGDLSWTNGDGTANIAGTTVSADHNWYATLAGRLGFAWDRWMVYGKGGAAWMDADYSTAAGTAGSTRSGWMAGGGIEYGLSPNWSAKLEYNYLDLGTDNLVLPPATSVDTKVQTLKAGINYRFNWDGPVSRR
jgi:outer membrane immunogenic protein